MRIPKWDGCCLLISNEHKGLFAVGIHCMCIDGPIVGVSQLFKSSPRLLPRPVLETLIVFRSPNPVITCITPIYRVAYLEMMAKLRNIYAGDTLI